MYGWMDLVFVIYLTGYETVSGFALFCVMKVNCVPQSSVLGNVLFVIFVTEICNLLPPNFSLKLFADDVKLYYTITISGVCVKLLSLPATAEQQPHRSCNEGLT